MPALEPGTSRIAVVLPTWVGDAVMATPVLRALRDAFPGAHLAGVMQPGLADVLAGNPWLNEMISCDMKGLPGLRRGAKAIASTSPEACLLLPNSFRTAFITRLAHVKRRIGYSRDGRGWLLTHGLDVERSGTPTPTILYYARLGDFALGPGRVEPRMELFTTPEEESEADRILHDVEGDFFLFNPGGNKPAKRWPAANFARTAERLHAEFGLPILLNGSPNEMTVLRSIMESADSGVPIVNLAERGLTLGSLKAVIRRAGLMITNDTGPRHMAAALGTPLVTLFGPTDHRWTTIDCPRERLLLAEPFLPETMIADDYPNVCRIERIRVEDVLAVATGLLRD